MINSERLWQRLMTLGEIGREKNGGVTRFSYTDEDERAKALITSYMKEASLSVTEDNVGNVIGRKEGSDPNAPTILVGSHIDTVKSGGRFDGALGVISGIEVLQTLQEENIQTTQPIEVIAFADEEGSRFQFGMIGSKAFTGKLALDDLHRVDDNGISIAEALQHIGHNPHMLQTVVREKESIQCYLELHIEQGKVLEKNDLSVGVVSGIAGPLWIEWKLIGESGHAGATPMAWRRDPMSAFAKIAQKIEELTYASSGCVATIGKVHIQPGGVNIIPNEITFTLDLRDVDLEKRSKLDQAITDNVEAICQKRNIRWEKTILQDIPPVPCDDKLQRLIKESCDKLNLQTMTLPSGAGHDAMQFHDICPVGMIFVRSKDGISHNKREFSSPEDCAAGANVLLHVIKKLIERNDGSL